MQSTVLGVLLFGALPVWAAVGDISMGSSGWDAYTWYGEKLPAKKTRRKFGVKTRPRVQRMYYR